MLFDNAKKNSNEATNNYKKFSMKDFQTVVKMLF